MSKYQEAEREAEREAWRETSRTGAALVLESGAGAAEEHLLAQRSFTLVSMMINSCSYSLLIIL